MKESDLIFGLMATFGKEKYSFFQLNHLVKPFHVEESCLRTNLSRMSKRGILKKTRQSNKLFYHFSKQALEQKSNVALGFKALDWSHWDESWTGVLFSVPEINKSRRYQIRKMLSEHRYAKLHPGFWIKPMHQNDLTDFTQSIKTEKYCKSIQFKYMDAVSDREVCELWNIDKINQKLSHGLSLIEHKERMLNDLNPEQALVEKMVVGDTIVKTLFMDPLLPKRFLPDDWNGNELRKRFAQWNLMVTQASKCYSDSIW